MSDKRKPNISDRKVIYISQSESSPHWEDQRFDQVERERVVDYKPVTPIVVVDHLSLIRPNCSIPNTTLDHIQAISQSYLNGEIMNKKMSIEQLIAALKQFMMENGNRSTELYDIERAQELQACLSKSIQVDDPDHSIILRLNIHGALVNIDFDVVRDRPLLHTQIIVKDRVYQANEQMINLFIQQRIDRINEVFKIIYKELVKYEYNS